ncbi:MAG: hypothetical protein KDK64_06400 [Chlamydiia bacterium]|nr:hypothetical protein [Chlamydiia bacterium]
MKRYAFSLMELMIALCLAATVLGVLFASLHQGIVSKAKLEKGASLVMTHARIQERLNQIFANIVEKKGVYVDKKKALHFEFDHGIDPEPPFCDFIAGVLEKKNNHLVLSLIAGEEKREEILCKATHLDYEFLYHDGKEVKTTPIWEKDTGDNPLYLKLTIDQEPYILWINHKGKEIPLHQ